MIRKESRYSLLAAYYNKNNELWYYRLADYDNVTKKIVEAQYITNDSLEYEPVTLYSKENKEEFKTVFKKWEYDMYDPRKQYIKEKERFKGKAYEIVFLEDRIEEKEFDEKYVRKILSEGFYVDYEVNKEFLLIVGYKKNKYVALFCNKNDFKNKTIKEVDMEYDLHYIDINELDLTHSTLSFPCYEIGMNSIISTENLLEHNFSFGIIERVRFFYEEVTLPTLVKIFLVREVSDYLITFFYKYFKDHKDIYELTNKEKNKFVNVLNDIRNDRKSIEEYFGKLGYFGDEVRYQLMERIDEIVNKLNGNDEYENILISYLLSNEKYYQKCLITVKDEWEKSTDFIKVKKQYEDELKKHLIEIENIQSEINKLNIFYKDKVKEIKKVENKNKELQENNRLLEEQIKKNLEDFKNDIVLRTKELAIAEGLIEQNKAANSNISLLKGYIHRKSKVLSESLKYTLTEIHEFEDFIEELIHNISIYFDSNKSAEIVASIVSNICKHKSLVVSEYTGEIIANAISNLIDKTNTEYYCITNNELDINRLFKSIRRSGKTVIYLDGILNSYNETLLKVLTKTFRNKILIFGIDDNLIEELSTSLWNFASYIPLENSIINKKNEEKRICCCDFFVLVHDLKKNIKIKNNIQLRKMHIEKLINSNQYETFNFMFFAYNKVKCEETIPLFILNQLYLSSNNKDILIDYINSHFDESIIKDSIFS